MVSPVGSLLSEDQVAEFRELVENYQPNPEAQQLFVKSNFAVIAGPAAAGKDTLRNGLLKWSPTRYSNVLSTTTRPKREWEVDGREYHFVDPATMHKELLNGNSLQAALVHNQQVSVMHIDDIKKLKHSQVGLSILVVQTEKQLRAMKPDIKTIFLVPPSGRALMKRLTRSRSLSKQEIDRRINAAKEELAIALGEKEYYCLVTQDRNHTVKLSDAFLTRGERNMQEDADARQHIKSLLREL